VLELLCDGLTYKEIAEVRDTCTFIVCVFALESLRLSFLCFVTQP
jgi:hypothetical protein